MSYDLYDFTETIRLMDIEPESIERVMFAWGHSPEGYGSWEGGFVMHLHDSLDHPVGATHIYAFGWCDTTGWGCQDGAACAYYDHVPTFGECAVAFETEFGMFPGTELSIKQVRDRQSVIMDNHDYDPADLNKWVREYEGR